MNVSQKWQDSDNLKVDGNLEELHLPLNPHKSELLGGAVAVVKEELLSGLNIPLREDTNSVITIYHQNLRTAVWVDWVVGKPDLVSWKMISSLK